MASLLKWVGNAARDLVDANTEDDRKRRLAQGRPALYQQPRALTALGQVARELPTTLPRMNPMTAPQLLIPDRFKTDATEGVDKVFDALNRTPIGQNRVIKFTSDNLVRPVIKSGARVSDVQTGQDRYASGLKGVAEVGTDAANIASLIYAPAKAGILAKGGMPALKVAPEAALRGAGAGAGINLLNQASEKGIGNLDLKQAALSAGIGAAANVALPYGIGKASRTIENRVPLNEVGAVGKNVNQPEVPTQPKLPPPATEKLDIGPTPPKQVKKQFVQTTDEYIGAKNAGKTQNVADVSQLPKVKPDESLDLVSSIQDGATTGDFGPVTGNVRKLLDAKYAELQEAGVDVGYLNDYFPQQWKNGTADEVNNAYQVLNQGAGIQNPRTIPTVKEGIALGFEPKHSDYRGAIKEYLDTADTLIANRKYFNSLQDKGLVVPSAQRPRGMQVIDAPGIPQAKSLMDGELGVEVQQNYYAKPEVAKELNKLFSPDIRGPAGKVAAATGKTSSGMQTLFLSGGVPGTPLNAFGAAQWLKQALQGRPIGATKAFFNGFSEKAARNYETKNLKYITKMQEAGVPYRGTLDDKALTTVGERIAEKTGAGKAKAAILEGWNKAVEDPTFRRMMPQMQLDVFKSTYERLKKSGMSEADATTKAAEATRNAFGLNSVGKNALKDPTTKDVTRTFFFAPKYRESMINFWGKNVKSLGKPTDPAYRENVKFLANATILFGAMQAANMALNDGKTTFQNENPNDRLSLSIPREDGKSVAVPFLSSIATLPRVAVNAGVDIAKGDFKEAGLEGKKLLSQLVRPPLDLLANQKYNGRQIYNELDSAGQKFKDAAIYTAGQYNHPYVRATADYVTGKSSGALETIASATELPFRFRNYDSGSNFGKATNVTKREGDTTTGGGAKLNDFETKGKNGDVVQLDDGRYAVKQGDKVTTHDKLKNVYKEINKKELVESGQSYKIVGDTVYRLNKDGDDVTVMSKDSFDIALNTNKLQEFKRKEDYAGWEKLANQQYDSLAKQLEDPTLDELERSDIQEKMDKLLDEAEKYASYGGAFKKGGSGGGRGGSVAGALTGSFKTAGKGSVARPKTVSVKKLSPGKLQKTRKLSVAKLPQVRG